MMRLVNTHTKLIIAAVMSIIGLSMTSNNAYAADENIAPGKAFPDKYMIRVGAYFVDSSDTQFSINSNKALGIGTSIDYSKDLGGEERDTIPRIDFYYRFNDRHRIDFTSFSIKRSGTRVLSIDLEIGDEIFSATETVNSEIKYTLYKLGYGYSFYHSPKVELSFTAGLNITTYDLKFANSTGDKNESAGVTAPLPILGLKMGYAITPKWSVNYQVEAFAIDIDDKFSGSLLNFELNAEYRLFRNFSVGAGVASIGLNAEVISDDYTGKVTDRYAGFMAFGALYF